MTVKRKRGPPTNGEHIKALPQTAKRPRVDAPPSKDVPVTVQVLVGSYDRVLHGITVAMPVEGGIRFADTFLFNAHSSAIRCLALSQPSAPVPGQTQKVILATGSTDQRVNLYNLSAHPPRRNAEQDLISSIAPRPVAESSKNRELGSLLHHSSTVTRLAFPTRSKLLSASEDSTIAVTRTRDWSLLSTIRAPVPTVHGRPSGDTAPLGGTPSGVNDFAIHPSMKLMISVSKGERCMRLWNLVTGKKAGVLNFSRDMLQDIGEGKHASGEGRKVVWGRHNGEDEFAVAFDRNMVVFGMDSTPKCKALADARTKLHAVRYLQVDRDGDAMVLAVSTEDGRVLFFSTSIDDPAQQAREETGKTGLPTATLVSQLGGRDAGMVGRIKDFTVLPMVGQDGSDSWLLVSAGSDGRVGIWRLAASDLGLADGEKGGKQVGELLGTYETHSRITCVEAFVMIPYPEGVQDSEDELEASDKSDQGSDDE